MIRFRPRRLRRSKLAERAALLFVALVAGMGLVVSSAQAAPAPIWSMQTIAPTYMIPGKTSYFEVAATNVGQGGAGEVTVRDELPAGVEFESAVFYWSSIEHVNLNEFIEICREPTPRTVICTFKIEELLGGSQIQPGQRVQLQVDVRVPVSAPQVAIGDEGSVEGGGANAASASASSTVDADPPFGITKFSIEPTETTREVLLEKTATGGSYDEMVNEPYKTPFTQAGGHPWALTSFVEFATEAGQLEHGEVSTLSAVHDARDVVVDLPPGLLGDPLAVPRCPLADLISPPTGKSDAGGSTCPLDTQVGVYRLNDFGQKRTEGPIFNVVPEAGQSAEFALPNHGELNPLLTAHLVRTHEVTATGEQREGYGFDVSSRVPALADLVSAELTFWGVPADPSHDVARGRACGIVNPYETTFNCVAGGAASGVTPVPFVTLPTDCAAGPETASVRADSWEQPGEVREGRYTGFSEATATLPAVTGCNLLSFNPGTGVGVEPDTSLADEPVGLGVGLHVPLDEKPGSDATPQPRDTTVTLPAGVSVSPGIVDGIKACEATGPEGINISGPESEEPGPTGELQLAPGHCPDASIVGSAEAVTPYLPVPVKGHVYLARPGCGGVGQGPCTEADVRDGNLYRLYLELGGTGEFADTGIEFKVPLETEVNPATGKITAVSRELVQAPYSEVRIHLSGGPRAPLANPAACGPATTTADFTPWSAPGRTPEGVFVPGSSDALSSSVFTVTGCAPGFSPGFLAGTASSDAAQFSPFTLELSRQDREQYVKGIQVHTPPGLLGMLSSVPLCGEPQADAGECPEASKIGTTRVATGAGSHPFEIEGNVYLTGPYGGSPFGLSIAVNVVAGPFNLGKRVVRARIAVDPRTSQLTITTDETGPYAIPQIVFGVPVRLKRITVHIDRSDFMFNPTSCAGQQITASISGSEGATANVSSPFAAGACKSLAFKPKFTVSTAGRTSRLNGASLDVKLSYPAGAMGNEANIATVKVELPKILPSRLTTLQQACLARTFETNPTMCPPGSIVGVARASTPLLPVTLAGPVYFVSHGGEAFPSLVVVLQGDGVRVDLSGSTFISKAGITSSTFKTVPDVPVSTFELYLPEGAHSALNASANLCKSQGKLKMPTQFTAQNGATIKQTTKITVTGCTKPKTRKQAKSTRHAKHASHTRSTR